MWTVKVVGQLLVLEKKTTEQKTKIVSCKILNGFNYLPYPIKLKKFDRTIFQKKKKNFPVRK